MTKLKIQYKKVKDLTPYAKNSRKHSESQVAQIAASIEKFGFNAPILLDGNNEIIAGHGRYEAAKNLNLLEVPTIDLTHLSDDEKRAYIIADNKIALNSEWDVQMLGEELDYLMSTDIDVGILGFSVDDLSRFEDDKDLARLDEMSDDEDDEDMSDKPTLVKEKPAQELYPLSVVLDHDQREVVFKAIRKAKQDKFLDTSGQAIWVICKEYLDA
jgi:ParB-like chromosome segregation protein Spo0J